MAAHFTISSILEKMSNRDKDFRFMAISDLHAELQKDSFVLDANSESRICTRLLELLTDTSGDVQGLAVKCIGSLVKRVHEQHVTEVVDKMVDHLLKEGKTNNRDIASHGLKTLVAEANPRDGDMICRRLSPRLVTALNNPKSAIEVKLECLEIANDMLGRFGAAMNHNAEDVQKAVLPQLTSIRTSSRKKAISCLARLSVHMPDPQFKGLVANLVEKAGTAKKAKNIRTFIQALGAISRSVAHRLGGFMKDVIPLVAKYCDDKGGKFDKDDELRENCFQTFESLVLRCPAEITPFLDQIIALSLEYIKYDPNYDDEESDDDDVDMDDSDGFDDDDAFSDDEDDYSDDDDMSWKVRRASTKTLDAVIKTRPELLTKVYAEVVPVLVSRFREREENVKVDVFEAFMTVLRQTTEQQTRGAGMLRESVSPLTLLRDHIPRTIASLAKQLKQKSIKTRVGCFILLKLLVETLPGAIEDQVSAVVPGIEMSITDKNSNSILRIETLQFLRVLLDTHPAACFYPHMDAICTQVYIAVNDSYYKITTEALRVCTSLVRVSRPGVNAMNKDTVMASGDTPTFDHAPFAKQLFDAVKPRLQAQQIEQEVKEQAITCTALVLANLGDCLEEEREDALKVILDRLRNEITRLVSVKAVETIARSSLHLDLTCVLPDLVTELGNFLRKANRQLRQSALTSLDVVVRRYGTEGNVSEKFAELLNEVAPLVSDEDLHLSYLGLSLTVGVLRAFPQAAAVVKEQLYARALSLLQSSLLQGVALDTLLDLFAELVKIKQHGFDFPSLLASLLSINLPRAVYFPVAQCVAVLCEHATKKERDDTVNDFIAKVKDASVSVGQRVQVLICLGSIGRLVDLGSLKTSLTPTLLAAFESPDEDVKNSASFALGNAAVGSLEHYLPIIFKDIDDHEDHQYLLLHSLREIIFRRASIAESLDAHIDDLLKRLLVHAESTEEGTRNVVAECLGRLAHARPDLVVDPHLLSMATSANVQIRSTVITALKFAIGPETSDVDLVLLPHMGAFLGLLGDKEIHVRRATLLTLNYAAHNKPSLLREGMSSLLPVLYGETKVKPELIRQVDLGPFKHSVDDGLETRKVAFECLYTLLETLVDKLNVADFISHLVDGLKDVYDIKMLCHLMLVRLASVAGTAVVEVLDGLIEPLRATVTKRVKPDAVPQEVERNDELVRGALRAVAAIACIPTAEQHPRFYDFLKNTVMLGDLGDKYEGVVSSDRDLNKSGRMGLALHQEDASMNM
eukprot:TRINITY_DN762_c0_g1_i1.p1 TRINITY_DN762_c0_g1~~TRINITY_DN762_c0_g1_i1.p1  ORF type:complete len:1331 (-),score=413.33 TRINITY_DN762_c0_g1_i1:65-3832(-)